MSTVRPAPSLALLAFTYVLTGIGIALLGPILPLLASQRHLTDAGVGLLPLGQFLGSCLGGVTVQRRPHRSFFIGTIAAAAGFGLFAISPSLPLMTVALFLGAWGGGQCIVSVNLIAGARYSRNRGSAITGLNFALSAGALLSPLLAAWLTPHLALDRLILSFAALFALAAGICSFELLTRQAHEPSETTAQTSSASVSIAVFAFYCILLVLYGAFETSMSVWTTTYMLRYGQRSLAESQSVTSIFWVALTASRAVASALLLKVSEKRLQRIALACTVAAAAALLFAQTATAITLCVFLVGASLGPVFPVTFAIFLGQRPSARQAGIVIASSGIGAALLPWLIGSFSRQSGSLREAFALPLAVIVVYFAMSFVPKRS